MRGWDGIEERLLMCDSVDFAAVTAVVDATHRYKEIFYSES